MHVPESGSLLFSSPPHDLLPFLRFPHIHNLIPNPPSRRFFKFQTRSTSHVVQCLKIKRKGYARPYKKLVRPIFSIAAYQCKMPRGVMKSTSRLTSLNIFIKIVLLKTLNSWNAVAWRCSRVWFGKLSEFWCGAGSLLYHGPLPIERRIRTHSETTVDYLRRGSLRIRCCKNTQIVIIDFDGGNSSCLILIVCIPEEWRIQHTKLIPSHTRACVQCLSISLYVEFHKNKVISRVEWS